MIVTPLSVTIVSPTRDSSQLPPSADAAMSTITEPDFISPTASAVGGTVDLTSIIPTKDRELVAAATVGSNDFTRYFLLGRALLGRQLAGVATRAGRVTE